MNIFYILKFPSKFEILCKLHKVHYLNALKFQDFVLYWKRNYLKPQQFQDHFKQVCCSQLNKFFLRLRLCQIGRVLHSWKGACCRPQTFHLSFHNISFLFLSKEIHKSSSPLYNTYYNSHSYFVGKYYVIWFVKLLLSIVLY